MTHPLLLQPSSPKFDRRPWVSVAAVLVGLGASACHVSTREDISEVSTDICADADQKYEFGVIQDFETVVALADPVDGSLPPPVTVDAGDFPNTPEYANGGTCTPSVIPGAPPQGGGWWSYGDVVPGSTQSAYVDRILVGRGASPHNVVGADGGLLHPLTNGGEPGARCGSTKALVLYSTRHRDWGAGFGNVLGGYVGQPQYGKPAGEYTEAGAPLPGYPETTTNRLNCSTAYAAGDVNADLGRRNVDTADGVLPLGGAAQGISFWAKADAGSSISIVVRLQDQQTYADIQPYTMMSPDSYCGSPGTLDLTACTAVGPGVLTPVDAAASVCDPRGNELISEDDEWPPPDAGPIPADAGLNPAYKYANYCSNCTDAGNENRCGNFWEFPMTITHEWALYRVSFGQFKQGVNGRRFSQVDRKHLRMMEFKFPKDEEVKIWIDDIGFYRKK